MMFIQDEGIIVNKLIEVLIKGLDYRERTERSEKRQSLRIPIKGYVGRSLKGRSA